MASPSTPTHGKLANVYRWRPNGFDGAGPLNDLTWGTGFSGADSAYFEVNIDAEATPDTFQWRKDGGGYTTGVAITGAAQTLSDGQTITFGATTGHEVGDAWAIGNLKDEPTSESGAQAQITDTTMRILNPNATPTFTDDGNETVLTVDHTRGLATFTGNVGNVDVDGNNGWIHLPSLAQVGYLIGWEFTWDVDIDDVSRCQQQWKEGIPGMGGGSGSAEALFIAGESWFDGIEEEASGTEQYHFLELYNYDPDGDQTGDHFSVWVTFSNVGMSNPVGSVAKESPSFMLHG
ncbi:MAG: hypothetical protein KAT70_00430, partial [Thermoplasmata archaeon]|nr:hypothetical protein [Thermoplasmata archaeon]